MLIPNDLTQIKTKNLTEAQMEEQLAFFVKGFPFLEIKSAATVEKGIMRLSDEQQEGYIRCWEEYLSGDRKILKFIPASGAASRMFKDLFSFLSSSNDTPTTDFEKTFFDGITHFAFFTSLNDCCLANEGRSISALVADGKFKQIVSNLLDKKGLNYSTLPKGLLVFHNYPDGVRTAMEEHLAESALYLKNNSECVSLHFTVLPEHQPLFEQFIEAKKTAYERFFSAKFDVTFSAQHSNTDTIAVDMDNTPFRDINGQLVFRPGGHGALIENLNDLDADVVFIKNIDNVSPDAFKEATVRYKKVIAGVLVALQKKIFDYIRLIESGDYSHEQIEEMIYFLQRELCIKNPETKYLEDVELILYIKHKLMRPLRICAMVQNEGEPGGGPFRAFNADGTISLQILESQQLNMDNPVVAKACEQSTHFNPVDLVCALKDVKGNKYNLSDYVDKNTGFISEKSKDGRSLKALELPGLWNGSMSDWNTVFVEVPIETFNPVKTVNDLLRPQHQ